MDDNEKWIFKKVKELAWAKLIRNVCVCVGGGGIYLYLAWLEVKINICTYKYIYTFNLLISLLFMLSEKHSTHIL